MFRVLVAVVVAMLCLGVASAAVNVSLFSADDMGGWTLYDYALTGATGGAGYQLSLFDWPQVVPGSDGAPAGWEVSTNGTDWTWTFLNPTEGPIDTHGFKLGSFLPPGAPVAWETDQGAGTAGGPGPEPCTTLLLLSGSGLFAFIKKRRS